MKIIEIEINQWVEIPISKKYRSFAGKRYEVSDQVDNFGDRVIMLDKGQPFMFISNIHCIKR